MIIVAIALSFAASPAQAQQLYGQRLASKDGKWLLPVATLHLGSTEADHIRRGSVQAWDLIAPLGSPVFPIADGVVEYAGCNNKGGYGCWTYIKHAGGIRTIMGHCVQGSILVKSGQTVTQWTPVCQVGWTGSTSFGPHTHLEIHKAAGGRYNISDFWDINAMKYQKLGNAASKEVATQVGVIGGNGTVATTQPATVAGTRYAQLLRILAQYPPQAISLSIMGLLGLLVLVYWLGGKVERIAIIAGISGMAGAAVIVWLFFPLAQPVQAGQQSAEIGAITGTAAFETALKVTLKREGSGCDTYIVRTLNGVTQWTYDRYRKAKGLPRADVCTSLTESEWRYIYYNYYWLPSGASALPINAAIPVFDHFVNAGRKITGCGDNVKCINQQRKNFYLSTADCGRRTRVCQAWLDRVEYIRRLTEGS